MSDLLNTIVMETSYLEPENCLKVTSSNVARQDSGVPEDLASPLNGEEDPDLTMNSECNITVIHISESQNGKTNDKSLAENKDSKDGSDSGVEGCATEVPRVRSRNSIDYTSSCGGLDDASCASSLVSCCSVYEDACGSTLPDDVRLGTTGGEGTSEGGSESSSIAGSVSVRTSRMNVKRTTTASSATKKKITSATESQKSVRTKPTNTTSSTNLGSTTPRSKSRTATPRNILTKTQSTSRERDHRPRSREKLSGRESNSSLVGDVSKTPVGSRSTVTYGCRSSNNVMSSSVSTPTSSSIAKTRTRVLPDSLPSALTTEINKDLAQRSGRVIRNDSSRSRTASSTRGVRTPASTPSEETRVKVPSLSTSRALCAKSTISRTDNKATGQDNKALDTYATLPRRNRNKLTISKIGEKTDKTARSRSGSRDVSLSRTIEKKNIMGRDSSSAHKSLPPYPRQRTVEKTRIYHETSAQTGLTGQDIENMISGQPSAVAGPEVIERLHKGCQTEDAWNDVQTLQDNLRRLNEESSSLRKENDKLKLELAEANRLLEEERADHAFARQELDRNAQRVLAMLGTPQSEHAGGSDSFLELECHIQSSGQVVANQQVEIADLQSLCRMLNRDLDKSLAAQKALLQQQQELEAESAEMQDFLQEEKATLADALKDAELELKKKGEALTQKETELERQTEECKHLVRISEQRRQENLSMSLKLNAVERRSRELLLTQGAAMSGAAVALSGLSTRLEGLVDQLIASYNISVKDLEVSLKERTPSPKSGSFVSAVISAIRNAATHPFAARNNLDKKSSLDSSKQIYKELSMESSSDLLDFETEPCLMMESVLEDVPLPDTYSHNMVSSSDSLRRALSFSETSDEHNMRKTKYIDEYEGDDDCDSVSESDTGTNDGPMPLVDYCPSVDLVDQVIEVDNLVTKLLKVLRIIQLDNDTCIQELKEEKSNLEIKLEATVTELNELRKIIDNLHQSPEDVLNNVSDRRRSVVENCRILLKETSKKELKFNEAVLATNSSSGEID
ncbi:hypothetical protein ALC56_08711 [Trachymyrmex septentrionalis]|uniref:Uncharacterized protein n=1 Tax=Trachymyrmex septentrionalis TaxID=34720 RepID=A0A195F8H2_9HYME|nr:hypothetical protein ALC56_08711 [Trachymyrmex septentrionalis]